MARRGRLDHRLTHLYGQNSRTRPKAEKANLNRSLRQRRTRVTLSQAAETVGAGNLFAGRNVTARKRSRSCLVLQSTAEGKTDDTTGGRYARRHDHVAPRRHARQSADAPRPFAPSLTRTRRSRPTSWPRSGRALTLDPQEPSIPVSRWPARLSPLFL